MANGTKTLTTTMEGGGFYNRNSNLQAAGIGLALPFLEEASLSISLGLFFKENQTSQSPRFCPPIGLYRQKQVTHQGRVGTGEKHEHYTRARDAQKRSQPVPICPYCDNGAIAQAVTQGRMIFLFCPYLSLSVPFGELSTAPPSFTVRTRFKRPFGAGESIADDAISPAENFRRGLHRRGAGFPSKSARRCSSPR
jgi:hypothetical protein